MSTFRILEIYKSQTRRESVGGVLGGGRHVEVVMIDAINTCGPLEIIRGECRMVNVTNTALYCLNVTINTADRSATTSTELQSWLVLGWISRIWFLISQSYSSTLHVSRQYIDTADLNLHLKIQSKIYYFFNQYFFTKSVFEGEKVMKCGRRTSKRK